MYCRFVESFMMFELIDICDYYYLSYFYYYNSIFKICKFNKLN